MNRRIPIGCALASLGLAMLIAGCKQDRAEAPPATHGVSYVLDWKRTKVESSTDGTGWEITNDLNFRVHVTHGYLVARSLELIPCNPVPPPPISLLEKLDEIIGPRPAYAGHSAIADPSSTRSGEVESLLDPQSHYVATLYPGPQTYCQAHYLIARADPQAVGLPKEVDMVDQSLRVEGWFRRPGQSVQEPFSVATAVGNGKLFDLPRNASNNSFAIDTKSDSVAVVIRRDLDTVFDHVDFAGMNEKRIGREILQNLIGAAEIELRVSHDG